MSYHSQPSSQKTRHYANLASKLQKLQGELKVTEEYMGHMSKQLDGMSKFGAYSGAQFMAASRLVDVDLQRQGAEASQSQGSDQQQ
ncbi:hypothetical protein QFC22_005060 [Naganishia vaughanmartiniae]|uniref:Uncharacterized protein n=1 Tax=Naganishia vaughanmartiniae TaxID=1424756 RepID=A0ACC2WY09_9TREE|nr:hypothetical protein QFC22_005060 [Naganishia vaughanmartiniae]